MAAKMASVLNLSSAIYLLKSFPKPYLRSPLNILNHQSRRPTTPSFDTFSACFSTSMIFTPLTHDELLRAQPDLVVLGIETSCDDTAAAVVSLLLLPPPPPSMGPIFNGHFTVLCFLFWVCNFRFGVMGKFSAKLCLPR